MNAGILAPGYAPPGLSLPLLGRPQPVPTPYAIARQDAVDPFWSNVGLLLRMDGANASTVFTDESRNASLVTANGNAQITTSNGLPNRGQCATFDGTGDFLELAGTISDLDLTGDFTVECWLNYTSTKSFMPFYCRRVNSTGTTAMLVAQLNDPATGNLKVYIAGASGGTTFSHTGANLADGQWHHVAVTRSGNDYAVFVDGTRTATVNFNPGTINYSSAVTQIGRDRFYTTRDYAGLIDEFRITKGVARYAATFVPPSLPFPTYAPAAIARVAAPTDPYWNNVALLMKMDGADASTTFTDLSPNAFPVTVFGGAKISTAQSQFGGSSALFNGSTDYLQIPTSTQFDFPNDFTVEGWFYPQRQDVTSFVVGKWTGAGNVAWVWQYSNPVNSRNLLFAVANNSGTAVAKTFSADLALNTWHYVAFARQSGVLRCFVNGTQVGAGQASTENLNASTATLQIGQAAGGNYFQGYLDELRITKGIARYTANFQPTAVPFPSLPSLPTPSRTADPFWNNVSLLIRGTGENNSTAIRDLSNNAFPVTVNGDAKISTAQSQYGGSSIAFDGTGDFLTLGGQSALAMGAGDFTVEMWIRFNSVSGQINFFDNQGTAGSGDRLVIYVLSTMRVFISGVGDVITTTAPVANQWYHIAVCKSENTLRLFRDGTQVGSSYTDTRNYTVGTNATSIGASATGTAPLNGFMQDIRITKGIARYTANFTPPSSLLPDY